MVRVCAPTTFELELKKTNQGKYYVKGFGSEKYNEFIELTDDQFQNNTYYFTTNTDECFERFDSNESDFMSNLYPYYENLDQNYQIPVPAVPTKISFISGYDMDNKSLVSMHCGDVFANINLLQYSVYLCALALVISYILFVFAWTIIHYQHDIELTKIRKRCRKKYNTGLLYVTKFVLRQLRGILYRRSKHFKWISLSIVILTFYLVTCFMILYKTSQIVYHEPFYVKNYNEMLNDDKSLPIFYDPIADVKGKFSTATKESLRGKIWNKLMKLQSKSDLSNYLTNKTFSIANIPQQLSWINDRMNDHHDAIIATKITAELFRSVLCETSRDGQLMKLYINSD